MGLQSERTPMSETSACFVPGLTVAGIGTPIIATLGPKVYKQDLLWASWRFMDTETLEIMVLYGDGFSTCGFTYASIWYYLR